MLPLQWILLLQKKLRKWNNMDKKNFIKTTDPDVAEQLRTCGYPELPKEGSFFVFVNTGKNTFNFDAKKVRYTDVLSL